jgi:hypothetical protein
MLRAFDGSVKANSCVLMPTANPMVAQCSHTCQLLHPGCVQKRPQDPVMKQITQNVSGQGQFRERKARQQKRGSTTENLGSTYPVVLCST